MSTVIKIVKRTGKILKVYQNLAPVGGGSGIQRIVSNISTNTTAGAVSLRDYVYNCTADLTLTMPTAVGNTNSYTINNQSGVQTIDGNGSENINGELSIVIEDNDSVTLTSNGTNWRII